jgi:crossover junction endodeoxyribonuclease RuvC
MRVLGIDCGVERTGYGVIESDGRTHRLLVADVIRTAPSTALETRLLRIAEGLRSAIREYSPASAAVEEVFYAVNVKTALKLAHVRGIALLVAAEAGLVMGEYSPLEVKSSVVGYGRAEKHQVQLMVQSLLGLGQTIESKDACDAVAVAICHANRQSTERRLAGVVL